MKVTLTLTLTYAQENLRLLQDQIAYKKGGFKVLQRPSQSPDLNLSEMLRGDFNRIEATLSF